MELKIFCAWWGLDHLGLDAMLKQIKYWGYDGVEIGIPWEKEEKIRLKGKLEDLELEVIAHQNQAQGNNELKINLDISEKDHFIEMVSHNLFGWETYGVQLLTMSKDIITNFGITWVDEFEIK
ncbi:hypothetical protein [Aquiflexum sp.]|uniref:hypothetical protein n=1 Tax=Aquiflexum sp. TaxID=1872584 RepID=UPI003593BAA3